MALIKWRKEFETGIPHVDYEHAQLVELINTQSRYPPASHRWSRRLCVGEGQILQSTRAHKPGQAVSPNSEFAVGAACESAHGDQLTPLGQLDQRSKFRV